MRAAVLSALLCLVVCATAQAAPVKKTGYITMSDGVQLRYAAELPDEAGRFPVVMKYDGYCEGTDPLTCNEGTSHQAATLLAAGYAVVGVSARGTGCSQGQFDMRSPAMNTGGAGAAERAARHSGASGPGGTVA